MAWTNTIADTFGRANTTAGGAGSTTGVGNGWIDYAGSTFYINSGALVAATSDPSGFSGKALLRPSGEAAVGQRITATWTTFGPAQIGLGLRWQSGGNYYLADLDTTSGSYRIVLFKVVGGTPSQLAISPVFSAPPAGHVCQLDFYVQNTSPTTLSLTATDVTAGTVLGTISANDSSSPLQAAGVPLVSVWPGALSGTQSQTYTSVSTYTGSPPVGATLSLSPTSVTGGATGATVTVTGTGTAFSGSPFVLSGGYGALLTGQAVSSGTAGTITLNPGLAGQGLLTVTDAASGASATLTVATPNLGALKVGFIGDSLTAGTNGSPTTQVGTALAAMGYTPTIVNQGHGGAQSTDWLPGAGTGYLAGALSAFASAGVTVVHLMLGTNDARSGPGQPALTPAQHAAQMRTIISALLAAGYQVVVSRPPWTKPNAIPAAGYQVSNDPNSWYVAAYALVLQLVDGVRVFQGDTGIFQLTALNPTTYLASVDGVHLADATANNLLGNLWATAIANRFGVAAPYRGGFRRTA